PFSNVLKTANGIGHKNDPTASASPGLRATRVRWLMASLVLLILFVDSVDRASFGIAGKYIQDEFRYSTQTMGWILSAFTLGYALFQIPWGYAGDRYGPRGVLTVAVLWSSLLTAATGLMPRFHAALWLGLASSFFVVRFLAGVGVAAAAPNGNKIAALWMSRDERGLGSSFTSVGTGLGGIAAPILITLAMERWGWRASFYLCGVAGVIAVVIWRCFVTNRPEEHPRVNRKELEHIHSGGIADDAGSQRAARLGAHPPWKRILSSATVWSLLLSYACQGYAAYIFYNWFYIYLVRVRGLSLTQGGLWGSTPFIAMTVLAPVGGWFSDRAVTRFGRRRGRRFGVWLGMGSSAMLLWAGARAADYTVAVPLLALAAGCNFFAVASWWAACIDLAPNYTGSLSALMNTCGNLGGWVSPIVTGIIAASLGWTRALDVAAIVSVAGGLLWFVTDASTTLEKPA
ncbi:MAG: MFS transporter, partial [Terriglobia bacterium]